MATPSGISSPHGILKCQGGAERADAANFDVQPSPRRVAHLIYNANLMLDVPPFSASTGGFSCVTKCYLSSSTAPAPGRVAGKNGAKAAEHGSQPLEPISPVRKSGRSRQ